MQLRYNLVKYRVYEIIEQGKPGDTSSLVFDWFIIVLIILNIIGFIIGTLPGISFFRLLVIFEFFSVIIFTIEYILRIWTANCNPLFRHPVYGRLRYVCSMFSLIDFAAILPFYLMITVGSVIDLRFIRIFRLFRLLRVLKLGRYSMSLRVLGQVFKEKLSDLVISVSIVLVLIILSASILYYVEHPVQPESFSSIPESMWWAICTLTTIGYGDIVPLTILGRFVTAMISILSIGIVALPAAILVSGYVEITRRNIKNRRSYNITVQQLGFCMYTSKQKQRKGVK